MVADASARTTNSEAVSMVAQNDIPALDEPTANPTISPEPKHDQEPSPAQTPRTPRQRQPQQRRSPKPQQQRNEPRQSKPGTPRRRQDIEDSLIELANK